MVERRLTDTGYAARALMLIAEMGVVRRKELTQTVMNETDEADMESGITSIGLKRGIKRLREREYIGIVKYKEDNYCYVTEKGWSYLQKYYPTKGYRMREWSPDNKAQLSMVRKRAIGLWLYKTMGIAALPSEKTSLARLCNTLSEKQILQEVDADLTCYDQKTNCAELFAYGVFYDMQEVRDTLKASGYKYYAELSTTCRGILINAQEIIFLYEVTGKRTVFYGQVEKELVSKICELFLECYEKQNRSPEIKKVCNILAADLRYLPTLVTGKKDGVSTKEAVEVYTFSNLSTFCAKRLQFFDRVQIVPRIAQYDRYRGDQYDYSLDDYEKDLREVMKKSKERLTYIYGPYKNYLVSERTGEEYLVCRYPDIKELFQQRGKCIEKGKQICVVGNPDEKIAEYISRSLQVAIDRYFSIEDLSEIPIVHYDELGRPTGKHKATGNLYISNLI
jgi:hypothetical protein